jgi:hypothetical protein
MRCCFRHLACFIGATWLLAVAAGAGAETWTLETKRLGEGTPSPADNLCQAQQPQRFFQQQGRAGDPQSAAFKKIVKKEPQYKSKDPVRGVVKVGSREFAFAIDVVVPESKEEAAAEKKDAAKDANTGEKKETKAKSKADAATAKSKSKAKKPTKPKPAVAQLYFDFNHNGDLTDDKVVVGKGQVQQYDADNSSVNVSFPRIDVAADIEGASVASSYLVESHSQRSASFGYTFVQFTTAAYRAAEIMLDGKKHRVALIDSNSNGRFDDAMAVERDSDGDINPKLGDTLLIDAEEYVAKKGGKNELMYDPLGLSYRRYLSKLVLIDGRYYDVKVTPAGDKLTLEPASASLGNVTVPVDGFAALVYRGDSFLGIVGDKGDQVPLPEGEWKLALYMIKADGKPDQPSNTPPEKGAAQPRRSAGPRGSMLIALANANCKAMKVVRGETAVLPFGPPYKPVVTASGSGGAKPAQQLALGMTLVGSGGEKCVSLVCNGDRPPKPKFSITDPKGKVVQEGSFEYG